MVANVLVVGVGDFGRLHAAIAAEGPTTTLSAVVDVDAAAAKEVADRYGTSASLSIEDALATAPVDVAIVATPEHLHMQHALALIEAGVPTLIEKPVSLELGDLETIAAAARDRGVPVVPGHVSRFLPDVARLLQTVDRPRSIVASRLVPAARRALHGRTHPAWMAMVHDLDLVAAMLPAGPVDVVAETRRRDDAGEHADQCWAMLSCEAGPVVLLENVWLFPHERQYIDARLRAIDDHGVHEVRMPATDGFVSITAGGDHRPSSAIDGRLGERPIGALWQQLQHLVDVADGSALPIVTLDDARRAGVLADAVVRAASTRTRIHVQLR
jgi:myo-inositol 2-dehydrogenase/D-chiro-inositol 1-dehydrogenase